MLGQVLHLKMTIEIKKQDIIKEIVEITGAQSTTDVIPNLVSGMIMPVIDVNPKKYRKINLVKAASSLTTGTATLYTTPNTNNQDFYLTGVQLYVQKDATCDSSSVILAVTPAETGLATSIITLPMITLTANNISVTREFTYPIKIAKNSSITLTGTFSVGVLYRGSSLMGYIVDT